ncbi:nucleotide sugar dehydrogenase [Cycloclasticus pugetii]|uniref:nucleotide sugar dehydrogenase n=1 Tax=Cycloclasticus pugetii TaxID=34068 RepID=UPI003A91CF88
MKINVYGAGLSAWVAAACLAKVGNDVAICEMSATEQKGLNKISTVRDEPNLLQQLEQQIDSGRLVRCSQEALPEAEIHWLAFQPEQQNKAEGVMDQLCQADQGGVLVVNQCNFAVGATLDLQGRLGAKGSVVYIPDNLQEGSAIQGFSHPNRIILGLDQDKALVKARALLRPFSNGLDALQLMSSREAEFTKFAITGMLAIRLGYVNELANLADQLDVDISVVQEGMGADARIGAHYLSPGCGFGGKNFHAYVSKFSGIFQQQQQQSLLKAVVGANEVQKELLFRKLWQHYNGDLQGKVVAIWGCSFKPGTASIDNAPSIKIINALLAQGVQVNIHDPEAVPNLKKYYTNERLIRYFKTPMDAVGGADALLLVTEWALYWSPDYAQLAEVMKERLIIDGRNIFDKQVLKQHAFYYYGVGR